MLYKSRAMTAPRRTRATRTTASDETRTRILSAARELAVNEGFSGFTVERVAELAGVSRMTVYYQFGSKADLLESLFDHLASRGRLDLLPEAFRNPDPIAGLMRFIEIFCGFWASDPVGIRRLQSWALVEPELEPGGIKRDAWRREGLEVLVGRIGQKYGTPAEEALPGVVDILNALLSTDTYVRLMRGGRSPAEIVGLLQGTARSVLGLAER
jgi:AcrR family transcriptional regulator